MTECQALIDALYTLRCKAAELRVPPPQRLEPGKYAMLGVNSAAKCVVVSDDKLRRILLDGLTLTAYGVKPRDASICHRCDDRRCVCLAHLFYGTKKDRARDVWLRNAFTAYLQNKDFVEELECKIATLGETLGPELKYFRVLLSIESNLS